MKSKQLREVVDELCSLQMTTTSNPSSLMPFGMRNTHVPTLCLMLDKWSLRRNFVIVKPLALGRNLSMEGPACERIAPNWIVEPKLDRGTSCVLQGLARIRPDKSEPRNAAQEANRE